MPNYICVTCGVQFAPTGHSGRMNVANEISILTDPADDVSVHDLDVVDIEE